MFSPVGVYCGRCQYKILQDPSSQHKGDLFALEEGQRVRDKDRRWRVREKKREQGRGGRDSCTGGAKDCLPLARKETEVAHS